MLSNDFDFLDLFSPLEVIEMIKTQVERVLWYEIASVCNINLILCDSTTITTTSWNLNQETRKLEAAKQKER